MPVHSRTRHDVGFYIESSGANEACVNPEWSNLNLLGQREPTQYGHQTLADVEQLCRETGARLGLAVECLQSNHEGY